MSYKLRKITERDRRVAAEILTSFMFTKNMDEVMEVWKRIYKQYSLRDDPFTRTPSSPEEYYQYQLEYDKQTMIEKYGHCDGLEE